MRSKFAQELEMGRRATVESRRNSMVGLEQGAKRGRYEKSAERL